MKERSMDADLKLIGTLFEELAEPDWASAFLTGVCEATQSPAGALLQVDVASRRQTLPAYVGQGREMAVAFERKHAEGNPWRPTDEASGPPAGSVVVPDDALPLSALRRTAFWSDFLRPMQIDHGCGLIGFRSPEKVVSLTLLRSAHRGVYDTRERAWLGRLAPHWVNACRLRNRLVPNARNESDAAQALDALGTAAFFLDERGRCARWNAAADSLLSEGDLVRLRGGHLVAAHPGSGALFASTGAPTVLRRRDGSVAGHASSHRLPGHGALGRARAVVFVDTVGATRPQTLRLALAAVYKLTLREAEVAELLSAGLDLSQVAATMGVSTEGVRTRVKVIYGKTGARNQAALVSLVKSLGAVVGTTD